MKINQNFSIPAGADAAVAFDVDEADGLDTLSGCILWWEVFEQEYGCPIPGVSPVLVKTNDSNSDGITLAISPPLRFYVNMLYADTIGLLRNYYHEAKFVDATGKNIPIVSGIMTVTGTEIRP